MLLPGNARAADVEITADTPAVNLDAETGSTAHIASGVTVGPSNPAISATLQAWSVTNDGTVTGGNTVKLDQGGTFTNASGASVTGSLTALTFGYKPIGLPPAGGPGTLNNYGTITGGAEGVTMWLGGTVNNYLGGTITTATGLNAVSIGQGTSRTLFNSGTIQATKNDRLQHRRADPGRAGYIHQHRHRRDLRRLQRRLRQRDRRLHLVRQCRLHHLDARPGRRSDRGRRDHQQRHDLLDQRQRHPDTRIGRGGGHQQRHDFRSGLRHRFRRIGRRKRHGAYGAPAHGFHPQWQRPRRRGD